MAEQNIECIILNLEIAVPNTTERLRQKIQMKRQSLALLEAEYFQVVNETEYLEERNVAMEQETSSLNITYSQTCVNVEALIHTKTLLDENLNEIEKKIEAEEHKSQVWKKRQDTELDKYREMWKRTYERYESIPRATQLRQAKDELMKAEENLRATESMLRQLQADSFKLKCERNRRGEESDISNLNTFIIEMARLKIGNESLKTEVWKLTNDCEKLTTVLEERRAAVREHKQRQVEQENALKQQLEQRNTLKQQQIQVKQKQLKVNHQNNVRQNQFGSEGQNPLPRSTSISIPKPSSSSHKIPEIQMPKFQLFVPSFKSAQAQRNNPPCTVTYAPQSRNLSTITIESNVNFTESSLLQSVSSAPPRKKPFTTSSLPPSNTPCTITSLASKLQNTSLATVISSTMTPQISINLPSTVSTPQVTNHGTIPSNSKPKEPTKSTPLLLFTNTATREKTSTLTSEVMKTPTLNVPNQHMNKTLTSTVTSPLAPPLATPIPSVQSPLGSVTSTPTDIFSPGQHAQFLASLKKTPEFAMVSRKMFDPSAKQVVSPVDTEMQIRPEYFIQKASSKVTANDDVAAEEECNSEQSVEYQSCPSNLMTEDNEESEQNCSKYFSGQENGFMEGDHPAQPMDALPSPEVNWVNQGADQMEVESPEGFQFAVEDNFCFGFGDGGTKSPPPNHNNSFGFGVTSPSTSKNNPFSFFGEDETSPNDGVSFNFGGKPETQSGNHNEFAFTF